MKLAELALATAGFSSMSEPEIVKLLIWWAGAHDKRPTVDSAYLRSCYDQLHRAIPREGFASILSALSKRSPPHVVGSQGAFKLEQRVAHALQEKHGKRDATIHVEKILTELPQQLSNLNERAYLEECLKCFRVKAYRATVVMAWNLAFDHLCYWILNDSKRLADFNATTPVRYKGMNYPPVVKREDFMDMKERHVIDIASSAGSITTNVYRILLEKLTRRNMAAHPADVTTLQPTAEEVVRDLIENVVLKLK